MLCRLGPAAGRVVAVVPVTLLVLFVGLLWLLGLFFGKGGRQYVTKISAQAMQAASAMMKDMSRTEAPASSRRPEL